jgi:UDP-N-acetylmuramyl pentapeptide synthase
MKQTLKKIVTSIILFESRIIIKKYRPKIVAITGSVGKTSTKDAVYTVLKGTFRVRKSEKSFNSEIGVPLTILGRGNSWNNPLGWLGTILHGLELILLRSSYPEYLVLEVGADHPGDIARLSSWLKPDVAVITKIGDVPVHVEFFPSPEALIQEKSKLAHAVRKTGTVILSADDDRVIALKDKLNRAWLSYGITSPATVRGEYDHVTYREDGLPRGVSFKVSVDNKSIPVELFGVVGRQHIYPVLAAVAVAKACGVPASALLSSFASHVPPKGRMRLVDGDGGSLILDDSYNSSPDALHEALNTLKTLNLIPGAQRIVVLGDMMELGKFSQDEHKKAGDLAVRTSDVFIAVGQRMALAAKEAQDVAVSIKSNCKVLVAHDAEDAGRMVKELRKPGDLILVKGSQSMRMERTVAMLMSHIELAGETLVRQEKEWMGRK